MRRRLCLLSLAFLGACAPVAKDPPATDEALSVLSRAAASSAEANRRIAGLEIAEAGSPAAPAMVLPAGTVLPPELLQPVSVDWNGPLEPLLQAIAGRAGYGFRVSGTPPAGGVMVAVRAASQPLFEVVRTAGLLVTSQAAVVLNPSSRLIEVRYE